MEVEDDMQWFRWWHDGTTDGKLLRLSLEHRWLWVALLTLASESPRRGYLYVSENLPCDIYDVARKADLDKDVCQSGIDLMMTERFNMVATDENGAWRIVNWEKRQPKREDATNAERQKRYRNAMRNAESNAPETESETETKTDTEKKQTKRKKGDFSAEFEELWPLYPHPPRDEKERARSNYNTLRSNGESYEKLRMCVERYARDRQGKERDFHTKMANFFGNKGTWMTYAEDDVTTATPTRTRPAPVEDDVTIALRKLRSESTEHIQ